MPELPEVEVVRRGLAQELDGRRVVGWWFADHRNVGTDFSQRPEGPGDWRVVGVRRHGKRLWVALGTRAEIRIHLGMSGRLSVESRERALSPHTHATFQLDDGRELRYVDPRRFGRCHLVEAGPGVDTGLGPDALAIDAERLAGVLRAHRVGVKAALLDQRLVAGIGNIYADEILHAAGVHPRMVSNRLTDAEIRAVADATRDILETAIGAGGSTIRDYVDARGQSGAYQHGHQVYGRAGESCPGCGGRIRRALVAGRSTHYCPQCQPMRRRVARPVLREESNR